MIINLAVLRIIYKERCGKIMVFLNNINYFFCVYFIGKDNKLPNFYGLTT